MSSPPCPRVTVCFGMNHTPSPCLGFPTGAGGPRLFCRRGTRRRQGPRHACSVPGWGPRAPAALHTQPMHSALHTCAHAGHTCQFLHACAQPDTRARSAQGQLTPTPRPLHTQACTLPGWHPPCTHVCNHTCAITYVHPVSPPRPSSVCLGPLAALHPRCAPLQRLRGNAPDLSMEILREIAPSEAGGRGGGLAGSWRGQTGGRGGRGKPGCGRGLCVLAVRCTGVCGEAAACTRVCKGSCNSGGGLGSLALPHTPSPKAFPAPRHGMAPRQAPRAVRGLRALRGQGTCRRGPGGGPVARGSRSLPADGQDFPSLWLVTAARDRASGGGSPRLRRGPGPMHGSRDPCSRVLSLALGGGARAAGSPPPWGEVLPGASHAGHESGRPTLFVVCP